MTNEVKKDDLTQEQKDFILKYLNRNRGYVKLTDPDKLWSPDASVKSSSEWFDNLVLKNPISLQDKLHIQSVQSYVTNGYSEMSELERLIFMKERLNSMNNPLLSGLLNLDEVKSATNVSSLLTNLHKSIEKVSFFNSSSKLNATALLNQEALISQAFKNYPATQKPEPEPVVEKPNWFETTSKDHQVRIEQWMEHVGMKDQAKDLIAKYGLPVAYEIVQTSMQSPKDVATATDGAFRNSKDSIKYFLDNSVNVEKLATLPDLDIEKVKASILSTRPEPLAKGPTIEMPSRVVSVPSDPKLSQFDAQKVQYAAIMRDTLKLEGIDENEIKAAVDVAFKANLDNTSVDMESWTGAFKYNLVKALGLEEIAKDKNVYRNWAIVLNDCSESVLETSATGKTSEELKDQVEIYTTEVNKKTLKSDLAGMSGTETLNPETYFKDRQVQKKLEAREAKKAEREAKKAERTENRQERRDNLKEWFNNSFKSVTD
jgi:hypothetical protein